MPSFTYSSLGGWTVLLRLRASPNFEYFSSFFTRQRTLLGCPTNLETSFPVPSLHDNYSAKPCLQRISRFATNICLRLTMLVSPIVSLSEQAETGNTQQPYPSSVPISSCCLNPQQMTLDLVPSC
ncbi:hypothetical protein M438DRAFT_157189 [Aureobasidium pullulans EXF-150]|uniref:Uncharacterized protein n=1 Tax=Aureobasidium pullulans EXF-150 TaxID=1043002 RepID=A0A074XML6_AURPU|nr:uncharacterized protein M438DRAFT_157189 [Aureobasidium pullulans EXF-150]KEQ86765.1 hypothetical protein M438DRAFT_157189 [Aureobasidium pullulans EXF-150]